MITTFLLILPYGLIGALSPMMFTEQTLILASRRGKKSASAYAVGAILTLFVFATGLVLAGRAIQLPDDPSLSAGLDLLIGVVMLIAAGLVHRHRDRPNSPAKAKRVPSSDRIWALFGFGVFSMATNFKAIALMVPAAKIIATQGAALPERVILVVVIVMIASAPAWLPLLLTALAPGSAERVLEAIRNFLERHGRRLVLILLLVLGTFFVVRGIVLLS